jgi:manganese/zinc/iron transport system permease protein
MTPAQIEIQLIAIVVAVACALPGAFLVLRGAAMMSDAISHAILPGIVVAFFLTQDLSSPLLVIAAAATGVLTVTLVELLGRTGLLAKDAAIGLVFPALFSIGVILIARHAGDVHLDTDAVLLGELAFAPFRRLVLFGVDLGPRPLYLMGGILLVQIAALLLFYKELKLASFDAALAAALGFMPALLHQGLMVVVSVTVVGAFDSVGSILVVALMVAPPAAASFFVSRLSALLGLAAALGVVTALSGYWLARILDASIAGSMAVMAGVVFFVAFLTAPERGLVAAWIRRRSQRWDFAQATLAIHLLQHRGLPEELVECRVDHLQQHLGWSAERAGEIVRRAERRGLVVRVEDRLTLSDAGLALGKEQLSQ